MKRTGSQLIVAASIDRTRLANQGFFLEREVGQGETLSFNVFTNALPWE